MKKVLFLCLIGAFCFTAFAQRKTVETEILKSRLDAGGFFAYTFDNRDVNSESITDITVPYAKYWLETSQLERNKFYLTGEMGYRMHKSSYDGEVGEDQFGMTFFMDIDPEIRLYIPNEVLEKFGKPKGNAVDDYWKGGEWVGTESDAEKETVNKWFFSAKLPIHYSNVTPQKENEPNYDLIIVDLGFKLGYDNKKIDIKKLSPWAKFQNGLFAYGLFEYRLSESNEYLDKLRDGDNIEMPMRFGLASDYANDLGNGVVKGFLSLIYQMEAESWRVFPWEYTSRGYKGSYLDLTYGIEYAHDLNKALNFNSKLQYTTWQLEDIDNNSINSLCLDAVINFYPAQLPELNAFAGFSTETHLKQDAKPTDIKFFLGAVYTLDFLKTAQEQTGGSFYDF